MRGTCGRPRNGWGVWVSQWRGGKEGGAYFEFGESDGEFLFVACDDGDVCPATREQQRKAEAETLRAPRDVAVLHPTTVNSWGTS